MRARRLSCIDDTFGSLELSVVSPVSIVQEWEETIRQLVSSAARLFSKCRQRASLRGHVCHFRQLLAHVVH